MIASLGEFTIFTAEKDYYFKPTFERMISLGDSEYIVELFATVHGLYEQSAIALIEQFGEHDGLIKMLNDTRIRYTLSSAIEIMSACYLGDDDIEHLTGVFIDNDSKIEYIGGKMPVMEIIVFAQGLMLHGISGAYKPKYIDNHKEESTSKLEISDYISSARVHLGLSDKEARNLSMSEFLQLIDTKLESNQKTKKKGFTKEQHAEISKDFMERRRLTRERIAREKAEANKHG